MQNYEANTECLDKWQAALYFATPYRDAGIVRTQSRDAVFQSPICKRCVGWNKIKIAALAAIHLVEVAMYPLSTWLTASKIKYWDLKSVAGTV